MQLIDRAAALEAVKGSLYAMNHINALPGIDTEPRGVIYSGDGYADGRMVYDLANCPACNFAYEAGDKDWGEPFCPHCGQRLAWEFEKEGDD